MMILLCLSPLFFLYFLSSQRFSLMRFPFPLVEISYSPFFLFSYKLKSKREQDKEEDVERIPERNCWLTPRLFPKTEKLKSLMSFPFQFPFFTTQQLLWFPFFYFSSSGQDQKEFIIIIRHFQATAPSLSNASHQSRPKSSK